MNVDRPVTKLVDGGHLSWTFGTVPTWADWDIRRHSFRDAIVCMDSPRSWRTESVNGSYKSRRRQKRDRDPEVEARTQRVKEFREYLVEDPSVRTCMIEGAEADDILAIHFLHNPELAVLAIDKDMAQVPGMWKRMLRLDGEPVFSAVTDFPRHPPKFWPGTRNERDFLLYQVMFGDRSDSIGRLLGTRDSRTLQYLYLHRHPFQAAYARWGDRLIDRLWQLLIPAVFLHRDYHSLANNHEELLDLLETGAYWSRESFPHQCELAQED